MKQGFWINYSTGLEVEINEHESWMRTPGNARKLGVPAKIAARFSEFVPIVDRDRFLTFVMSHAPIMRVRGHGIYISFEFAVASDATSALESIRKFCDHNAGARTSVRISNLTTNKTVYMPFSDFREEHGRGEIVPLFDRGKRLARR